MTSTEKSTITAYIETEKTLLDMPSLTLETAPSREKIKHTLIGSQRAVKATIKVLQQLGYAQVDDWSPLLPSTNPGEVISILIRSISVQ